MSERGVGTLGRKVLERAMLLPVALLNGLTSRRGYQRRRSVPYGPGSRQTTDIYVPEQARPEAPVVVFFHGGSWDSGAKELYVFVGQSLAKAGMIVAIPDYRLYPEVVFPGFMDDAAAAVAWAAKNLAGAGGPLVVAGHSAGAHIALLVVLDRHYLAATDLPADAVSGVVGLSGPYDFLPLREPRYKAIFPELMRAASQPIAFADHGTPPMLLITGAADRTVKPGNATRLAAAVTAHGGTAIVKSYAGIGHLGTVAALSTVLPGRKPTVRADMIAFIGGLGCR